MRVLTAIHQRHANKAAAELYQKNIELVGMPHGPMKRSPTRKPAENPRCARVRDAGTRWLTSGSRSHLRGGGSSDVGEVTLVAPTATIGFRARCRVRSAITGR